MSSVRSLAIVVACCVIVYGVARMFTKDRVRAQAGLQVEQHERRTADSDLEVRGLGNGPRFVTRSSLEALPQVEALVKPDENFTEMPKAGVKVRGVTLETLGRALGPDAASAAIEGVCTDGYTAPFPVDYLKAHHPILVLTVEGMTPKGWSEKTHTEDMSPYFVAYDNFVPAFHVLSHEDRPQVPVQMVRLVFAPGREIFAGTIPEWTTDSDVTDGYKIAQQNCFRCHNAAGHGGTKSGQSWTALGKDARDRPEWFAKWVHDPQSVDKKAEMPPNPKYDGATLAALTKYFSTMK